jgi:hypothetical protein
MHVGRGQKLAHDLIRYQLNLGQTRQIDMALHFGFKISPHQITLVLSIRRLRPTGPSHRGAVCLSFCRDEINLAETRSYTSQPNIGLMRLFLTLQSCGRIGGLDP